MLVPEQISPLVALNAFQVILKKSNGTQFEIPSVLS